MKTVCVLNGPNLNLLGQRDVEIYGRWTLEEINVAMEDMAKELDVTVVSRQTNDEAQYIEWIHDTKGNADFLILNPGAWTHTSIAIRDALLAVDVPAVEVHLSNVYAREPFRHVSHIADVVIGRIIGLGPAGYLLALQFADTQLDEIEESTD